MAAYADFHEYFCEWTPLPETSLPAFFLADPLAVAARYLRLLYELVTQIPLSVMDGVVLAFLAGVGLCAARTAWRRWLPFVLWIAANLGFFAFTFSLDRFLYVLIPLLAILAALGLHIVEPRLAPASSRAAIAWTIGSTVLWTAWFLVAQSRTAVAKVGGVSLAVAFFLLLFLLGYHLRQGTFLRLSRRFVLPFLLANLVIGFMVGVLAGVREHRKERYPGAWIARLQALAAPGETIMVYRKPYFYGWILDRDIVQMPIEREKRRGESEEAYAAYRREYRAYLADLLARFRVAWIVNKGRKRKGATPPGEASVIYTHGWPPGGEPLPAIRYRESHAFGNTVYDVYRVTAPTRERDTPAGARRVPEG